MVRDVYKQTEVGEIPEDWNVETVGETAPLQRGFDLPTRLIRKGEYPVAYSNGIQNYHYEYMVKGPGVFTGRSGTIGNVHYVESNYWPHNTSLWVTDFKGNHPKYIYYLLTSLKLSRFGGGSGVPTLNRNDVHDCLVPIPEYGEQKEIATALSDVDELILSLEKLIAKKRDIKTATMQQLLTGKKRLPGFGKDKGYKQTELGEIPEDWDVDDIGKLVTVTTGDKNTQDRIDGGQYPFFVRSQTVEKINSYSFDGEGVLTAGDGVGTGKIFHYINGKFDYHQRVYLMHGFSDRLYGKFFYIYFSKYFYDRIMSMTAKSSVDSVRREMITGMPIFLPSPDEQEVIANTLFDMDSEIDLLSNELEKTKAIKQGMMQELLKGRTRLVDVPVSGEVEEERMHGT